MQAAINTFGMRSRGVSALLLLLLAVPLMAQERIRIVTYNVENLFDCADDSLTNDEEFLPDALRRWTPNRYWNKLHTVARTLATIGGDRAPDIVGLCEVENDSVLHDLTHRSALRSVGYEYLITTSLDPRGIDVALLYKPTTYRPFRSEVLRLPASQLPEGRTVRDVLCVSGLLVTGDTLDVLLCHLPSRLRGRQSAQLRHSVATMIRHAVDSLAALRTVPRIVVMGDFNDLPTSRALHPLHDESALVCATEHLGGSYRYKGRWEQIDHLYLSPPLVDTTRNLHLAPSGAWVAHEDLLIESEPLYGGYRPRRTYNGMRYLGGTSDHLPTCLDLLFTWEE